MLRASLPMPFSKVRVDVLKKNFKEMFAQSIYVYVRCAAEKMRNG